MTNPVVHFHIEGIDGPTLRSFYSALFGWETTQPAPNSSEYAMLLGDQVAGSELTGAISRVPDVPSETWRGPSRSEGYPGHVTIYVSVDDLEATLRRVEELGGSRMLGPDHMAPGVDTAMFADPEGHLIGLVCAGREC